MVNLRSASVGLLAVPALAALGLLPGSGNPFTHSPGVPWVDVTPPSVSLAVFGDPNAAGFFAVVDATDASGIASVQPSWNGFMLPGRIRPPYHFIITPLGISGIVGDPQLPPGDPNAAVEICALVTDRAGNSTTPCETVTSAPLLACSDNAGCPAGSFCSKATGACGGEGVCARPPIFCRPFYPGPEGVVCGCDGNDYWDECMAHQHVANVAHEGPCQP
jgi:hypothetical protein